MTIVTAKFYMELSVPFETSGSATKDAKVARQLRMYIANVMEDEISYLPIFERVDGQLVEGSTEETTFRIELGSVSVL